MYATSLCGTVGMTLFSSYARCTRRSHLITHVCHLLLRESVHDVVFEPCQVMGSLTHVRHLLVRDSAHDVVFEPRQVNKMMGSLAHVCHLLVPEY